MNRIFGLIGKKIEHSFSNKYFNQKFIDEGMSNTKYMNFILKEINVCYLFSNFGGPNL